jgi:hypothetical protein
MPEALKKTDTNAPPPQEEVVQFAEELRLPLTNAERDAFLKALEEDRQPTEAALRAVQRYNDRVTEDPSP